MRRRASAGAGRPLRPLAQLLLDAAFDRCATWDDGLAAVAGDDVVDAGFLHRISPAIARATRGWTEVSDGWRAPLRAVQHRQMLRHLRALEDLKVVGAALDRAGIAWVVVKGATLASVVWPHADMREYYDLDLLVEPASFRDAVAIVESTGGRLLDRNWPALSASGRGELAMVGRHGTPLDLHWHLAVAPSVRRAFPLDVDAMLARRRHHHLSVAPMPVLDPEDQALHVAVHAAQAGANRLVWLADVYYATRGVDWEELARRCRRADATVPVALVVDRAYRVAGRGSVPSRDLAQAADGVWGRLARSRDDLLPFPGLPGDRRLGGNIYGAARPTVPASMWRLGKDHVAARYQGWRHRHGRNTVRPWQQDVPDPQAREAYFATAMSGG
ncbi:putative nucleotidyltransferase-like protein [Isoptericola sp. CG 20/1183]|uniref:Nucleotidyltransferase-like protein n=1 Tax=Isoptericola halotolerans TaxID=300560 RepID=A0ABX5EDF1_9MICO|nr:MULTISPECIES: nucleotidyltransferase family protein [Isoptericola]PRZ06429.1 putative nucleotidyltransferase-like protein [Isoptericola halotolerans]PRZ06765.1 putative nucleotidyltransferase-like protein [Isoptericola sp. CG 20/1183]